MTIASHLARRTDPQSSHSAAEEVTRSGKREGQVLAVLALVRKYPGRTSLELSTLSFGLDRYQVARRTSELEDAGLIRKGPTRGCSVGKRPAVTWEPVKPGEPTQMRLGI